MTAAKDTWLAALGDAYEVLPELREEIVSIPLAAVKGEKVSPTLIATLYQPQGMGPFPVVVLSHGTPKSAQARAMMGRYRVIPQTKELLRLGFAVLVPMRRGYGATGGECAEWPRASHHRPYVESGRESTRDVLATIAYARTRATLDTTRIVLMGQSSGGIVSLAAAARAPAGVVALILIAAGRGGMGKNGIPCASQAMAETIGLYAKTTRAPALWLYAQNDKYFGPAAAHGWFNAFTAGGGIGQLIIQPPFGIDGHGFFYSPDGIKHWLKPMAALIPLAA